MELNTWLKLSDEEYHSLENISFHGLLNCLKSYNHYVSAKAIKKDTPAMRFGRLAHKMFLEPNEFESLVRVAPVVDKRTKEGKAEFKAFQDSCPANSIIIDADDFNRLMGMKAALQDARNSLNLKWIFDTVERTEEAMLFNLTDSVVARMKPDMIGEDYILDYKTTQDAWIWGFSRTARYSYYDLQLFFYQKAEMLVSGKKKQLLILAQESEPPYEFQVYKIDQSFESEAWNIIDIAFNKYIYGLSGEQKGYPRDIISLDMTRFGGDAL